MARALDKTPHKLSPPPPTFTATAESIILEAENLIAFSRQVQDAVIANVDAQNATFANTIVPLAHAENTRLLKARRLMFYRNTSPSADIRNASGRAAELFEEFDYEIAMSKDLFLLIDAVHRRVESGEEKVDAEDRHLVAQMREHHARHGVTLTDPDKKKRFAEIREKLDELVGLFYKNLDAEDVAGDDAGLWFTKAELDGLEDSFLGGLKKKTDSGDEKFLVKNFNPVFSSAHSAESRKRAFIASENKYNDNVAVYKQIAVLRDEAARLLGFANHADFMVGGRMIRSLEEVKAFLKGLIAKLSDAGKREMDQLKQLKKENLELRGEQFDGHFFRWDLNYYQNILMTRFLSVKTSKIREYLPLPAVVTNILAAFGDLFGLEFVEITKDNSEKLIPSIAEKDLLWHEDIQLFGVWDADEDDEFLGYLYLDLYERNGKSQGMRASNIEPGFVREDGTRQHPSVALLWNLPKSTPEKPTLLSRMELQRYLLHEFGHGIHDLASKTRYARFHGPSGTVIDFGEAPSQVLENWAWTPSQLKKLSRHYSTLSPAYLKHWQESSNGEPAPPETMPDDMIEALMNVRYLTDASFTLNQLHLAAFDLAIYQPKTHEEAKNLNISAIWNTLKQKICLIEGPLDQGDEWGHGYTDLSTFITSDYTAGYYSYYIANLYSADIFDTFFKDDPESSSAGRRYRRELLEKGGSLGEMNIMRQYLGRDGRPESLYKELNLG
ncbi:metallopeptidase MepB [Thozetella sp. PMI_491]|nr:metallopeptidase MepB [Thozetella sp. PMI_491]